MARIKLVLSDALVDGMDVKFKAPCNCTEIEGLTVQFPTEDDSSGTKEFSFRDAHGNDLTGIGNLFSKDAYVKVILDTVKGYAYIQNADNNSYLHSAVLGTYTESSAGLIGSGVNGKFKTSSSGSYSSITVNGSQYAVRCGGESSVDLIAGCWYTFILDGNTINFNSGGAGGGLSFKVVGGTTAPASPKENDIWVNTDTEITGWHFGADEPNIYALNTRTESDAHAIVAPHKLTTGDIVNFEIPAVVYNTKEAICLLDQETNKRYYIRNGDGTAAGSWPKGTMVGVLISDTSMPIGEYGSGAGTALIRAWGKYYHKEGETWILTGASSPVGFNALKKNGLTVYPLSAKQYIGGAWVEKTAKSYHGGAWVEWWSGQLYENGNTYASVTGGYSTYGDGTTLTENADHLYIESTGPSGVYNNTPVDMTKYSTITFVWTCVRGGIDVRFQVRSDKSTGGSGWAAGTTITAPEAKQHTTTLDISSLSGSFYVGIGRFSSGGPCQLKIHSIIMT